MPSQSFSHPRGQTPPHQAGLSRHQCPSKASPSSGGQPHTSPCPQQTLQPARAGVNSAHQCVHSSHSQASQTARQATNPVHQGICSSHSHSSTVASLGASLPARTSAAISAQQQQEGTHSPQAVSLEHLALVTRAIAPAGSAGPLLYKATLKTMRQS